MIKFNTINNICVREGGQSKILKRKWSSGSDNNNSDLNHMFFNINHMYLTEEQALSDSIKKIYRYKQTLLSKKQCDRVFHDEYKVLPAMEYTKDTVFGYYVSIYTIPNLNDLHSMEDIAYLLTCSGKTLYYEGNQGDKNKFMFDMGSQVWERLQELPPIRNPLVETVLDDKEFGLDELLSRKEAWLSETLGVLEQAPRTYLDMVVTKPGRNLRILFKIIDGFKCDILWNYLDIEGGKKYSSNHPSRLESYSYKEVSHYRCK